MNLTGTLNRSKSKNNLLPVSINKADLLEESKNDKSFDSKSEEEQDEINFHDVKSSYRHSQSEKHHKDNNLNSACSYNVSSNNSFAKFDDDLIMNEELDFEKS